MGHQVIVNIGLGESHEPRTLLLRRTTDFTFYVANYSFAILTLIFRRNFHHHYDLSSATSAMGKPICRRRLCSRVVEKRDSDEANNHQGGTSEEHVPDMISGGARSNSDLVVVSHDRTFVRVHRTLLFLGAKLPIAGNSGTPRLFPLTITFIHRHHKSYVVIERGPSLPYIPGLHRQDQPMDAQLNCATCGTTFHQYNKTMKTQINQNRSNWIQPNPSESKRQSPCF